MNSYILNKIRLVGKILPFNEEKNDISLSSFFYFNLLSLSPNNLKIVVRCSISEDILIKEKEELLENGDKEAMLSNKFVEIKGYLINDNPSRQFIVRIDSLKFLRNEKKSDSLVEDFDEVDPLFSNQVRLLGKISTNVKNKDDSKLVSFKLSLSKNDPSDFFFCRVQGELYEKFIQSGWKKGDVLIIEGFLQTKGIVVQGDKKSRISSIVCQWIYYIDSSYSSDFNNFPLSIKTIHGEVRKIDFDKPKESEFY